MALGMLVLARAPLAAADTSDDCDPRPASTAPGPGTDKPDPDSGSRARCRLGPAPEAVPGVDALLTRLTSTSLSTALSTKEKNTEFRATFVPAEFLDVKYRSLFSELRLVLLANTDTSLTRVSVSTGYNPFAPGSARSREAFRSAMAHAGCDTLGAAMVDCHRRLTRGYWRRLHGGWTPAVLVTGSYDFYPYGRVPDEMDMAKQVALEWNGGPSGQLALELRPHERWRMQAWGTARYVRPDGKPTSSLSTVVGGGLTISGLVVSFLPKDPADAAGKVSELPAEYMEQGFIAGIGLGASIQLTHCNGEDKCSKGRTDELSVTPYIDILASSKVQLRLAVPITRFTSASGSGAEVAGTFSIAGSLGTP